METATPQDGQSTETADNNSPTPDNTVGAAVESITNGISDFSQPQPTSDDNTPPAPNTQPPGRVYDGLDDNERDMFQRMSNRGYKTLYPLYLESRKWNEEKTQLNKQLEALKGASFYEEEHAYQVTPEYKELEQTVSSLSGEAAFWNEQLAKIGAGQPYSVLLQDGKGGVVVSNPIAEYNQGEAQAQIIGALTKANSMVQHYSDKLSTYSEGYKTKYEGAKKSLESVENKIFAGADMKKLDAAAAEKAKIFPQGLRSVPVKTLARALVIIDGLIAMNRRIQGTNGANTIKNNIARSAGPGAGQVNTGVSQGKTVGSAMEEFKKAKAMGVI